MKIVRTCPKERTINQFSLKSLPTKILRIIENLERKEVRHAEALQSVRTSNFGGEVLETLKEQNASKEENHDFKRAVGIDLESIYARLKEDEFLGSDKLSSPSRLCTDISSSQNSSRYRNVSSDLDGEDCEILDILKEMLEGSKESETIIPESKKNSEVTKDSTSGLTTVKNRLCGYFCSETIFNLSHRVLTDAEIKVLGQGLDFAPIQRKINDPELRRDFNEFCRRMRLKWHFRDEPQGFNEKPAFTPKSTWHPPKGHGCPEVFLSQVEKETFEIPLSDLKYSNMSREERQTVRSLADDRSIVIKKADRGLV